MTPTIDTSIPTSHTHRPRSECNPVHFDAEPQAFGWKDSLRDHIPFVTHVKYPWGSGSTVPPKAGVESGRKGQAV